MSQKRKIKDYAIICLKGMAMGMADVVPGVSGGTIAFISGIYEELLESISVININLFKTLKNKGIKSAWNQVNGNFLAALLLGIAISVISLAKLISWLMENHHIQLWSFFFGLVVASVIYIAKQVKKWSFISIVLLFLGAIIAYIISSLPPLVSEKASPLFLFISGALAICAMILPGISGSFILVLLGAYKQILNAVKSFDIKTITIVGLGAIVGLLSFSKILKFLFKNHKNETLCVLTGFIIGSLTKIWPWKETLSYRLNSHGEQVPFNEVAISPFSYSKEPLVLHATLFACLGFLFVLMLERFASTKKS